MIIAEDAPIRVLIRNHLDFKGKVSRKRYLHFRLFSILPICLIIWLSYILNPLCFPTVRQSFLLFLPHFHFFSALPLSFFVQRDAGLPRRTVASLTPLYIKEAESTAADGP